MSDKRKYGGKRFINTYSGTYGIETIDEANTVKEATVLLRQYREACRRNPMPMWISQRPDNSWYGGNDEHAKRTD